MGIASKLSWRLELLHSKLMGREVAGWRDVLEEIFRSHSPQAEPGFFSFERQGDFFLVSAPNGLKVFWPVEFDPANLGIWYTEVFGEAGCIYEYPGKVEVKPGDWVVDGGACEGFFSLYCLSKGASVLAVEPNPRMAQALKNTLKPYIEEGRAKVVQAALGEKEEETELVLNYRNAGGSSLITVPSRGSSSVRVSVVPLDRLVEKEKIPRVDFVKLDVEGFEREVIRGAKELVCHQEPRWAIACYHRTDDHEILPTLLMEFCPSYQTFTRGVVVSTLEDAPPYLRPLVLFAGPEPQPKRP